ncbi:MAG: 30S ribosomal protein S20 [Candidatus Eisenbacteria bacterium]|nr:30S ribosomal protein S20 [Candidatus Eisenbacteria bacterium]
MPRHKSPAKRARQTLKRSLRNKGVKSRLKTEIKKLGAATSKEEASANLSVVSSLLDKASRKGILNRRTVSRQKSRLSISVNKLQK